MVAGRPAEDLIAMAKELIEWSYLPTSLNLIGFSSPRRFSVTRLPDWAAKDSTFSEALQFAKENIAQNRFRAACNKEMPEQFHTRCEAMYDPLYHKHVRDEKVFDASLSKESTNSEESIEKLDDVMVYLKSLQI